MAYYAPEIIAEVKKIDLLTYLKTYEPHELVHIGGNNYTTKTHDSLKISNGLWNWFSKGVGGKTALEYLIQVKGYSFMEAMESILKKEKIQTPIRYENTEKKRKTKLILPEKSNTNDKVIDYLENRGIDKQIIDYCIENNLIYQEIKSQNVVFVGYDENKEPKYAGVRATNDSRYMRDATGSDKKYSFRLEPNEEAKETGLFQNTSVHLFESAIDLLSFATMLKLNNSSWKNTRMISLAGVYQPAKIIENSKIPITIDNYLKKNPFIKYLVLHFDKDRAGMEASTAFQLVIPKKYKVIDSPPSIGKDLNDELMYRLGMKNNIKNLKKERTR